MFNVTSKNVDIIKLNFNKSKNIKLTAASYLGLEEVQTVPLQGRLYIDQDST